MQGQSRHGSLVTDIENDMIVGGQTIMIPFYLRCYQGWIAQGYHQVMPIGLQQPVMLVQTVTTGVGKQQRTFIRAFDIREVGRISIGAGLD